jgi:hypothetical protein
MNISVGTFIAIACQGEVGTGVENTVAPSLSAADYNVGTTVTVSLGTWTGVTALAGSLRYVSDDTEIDTFTADGTYLLDDADFGQELYLYVVPDGNAAAAVSSAAVGPVAWPYLLQDEMTDELAVDLIHNTLATDGVHTRNVIDTADKLTMTSGYLFANGGNFVYNDPGIWYTPYLNFDTDTIAVCFTFRYSGTPTGSVGISTRVASGDAITGQPNFGRLFQSSTINMRFLFASNKPQFYFPVVLAASTDYQVVFIAQGANGMTFLIKGGVFTDWALVGIFPPDTISDASPAFMWHSGTFRVLDIRATSLIPAHAPIAGDSFNRSNGSLGSTDGSVNGETGGGSLAWTTALGTWGIATNKAQASALDGTTSNAIATIDPAVNNIVYSAFVTRTAGAVGIVLKYVDADNYIRAQIDGTNMKLIKRVAGSETDVLSTANTSTTGWLHVVQHGNSYTLAFATGATATTGTISDAAFSGQTKIGLYTSNIGNTIDWIKAKAIGGGGEYADFTNPFPLTA